MKTKRILMIGARNMTRDKKDPFEESARDWDKEKKRRALADAVADAIRDRIDGASLKNALEVGCGTGLVGLQLLPLFDKLTLSDSSPAMIGELSRKIDDAGRADARPLLLDVAERRPPDKYDCVFSSMAMHHMKNWRNVVKKLAGALNPGGFLLIADLDAEDGSFHGDDSITEHHGFDRPEVEAAFLDGGLSGLVISTVLRFEKERNGVMKKFSIFLVSGRKS